jgi:soluble lytic murein transglycosylase-like protein
LATSLPGGRDNRVRKSVNARFAPLRGLFQMKRLQFLACAIVAVASLSWGAQAQDRAQYEKLVATHARANLVPEALVHRIIVRESKYHPDLVGRGGTIGLMQIKLATARGLGYAGDAQGLRDPDTNLAYGTKYLAGAYRAANGDHARAMHYYASGYYHVAKQQRLERRGRAGPALASAPAHGDAATSEAAIKPQESAKSSDVVPKAKPATAKSKEP